MSMTHATQHRVALTLRKYDTKFHHMIAHTHTQSYANAHSRKQCVYAEYSFSSKVYVRLATPIVVVLFLATPVGVVWFLARRQANLTTQDHPDAVEQQRINWRDRKQKTKDVFVNNLSFWLFLIYPGMSRVVASTFVCRRIYLSTYLVASNYQEACPWCESSSTSVRNSANPQTPSHTRT